MNTHLQPILVDGAWRQSQGPVARFHPFEPARRRALAGQEFPVSSWNDIEALLDAGQRAALAMSRLAPGVVADFLERYAQGIEARTDALVATAHRETGLPTEPRLRNVELPRATNQLRQAARAARDGSWARPTLDTAANIRSLHGPLGGPVVVFGPNNFPFAFNGIAGGDFAAAIAAGNPVIAKAHPAHPQTSVLLAEAAQDAADAAGLPTGAVQMFFHAENDVGLRLARDRRVGAIAFTGSRAGGLALKAAADAAGKPVYLEMSSVNPLFVLAGAVRERGDAIAAELHGSCAMGAGQFCTKPGLSVVQGGEAGERFVAELARHAAAAAPGVLLSPHAAQGIGAVVEALRAAGAEVLAGGLVAEEAPGFGFQHTLLRVSGARFLANSAALQSEAFGQVHLVVVADSAEQLLHVAEAMEGNLTGTIYSDTAGGDDEAYAALAPILRARVGRLLDDKMPTGVAVSAAMNHGGPFPATGHPGFTAVGFPASMLRFSALHSYDNVRAHRLPAALQDRNPTGSLLRLIDGEWTARDV